MGSSVVLSWRVLVWPVQRSNRILEWLIRALGAVEFRGLLAIMFLDLICQRTRYHGRHCCSSIEGDVVSLCNR